ncbi:hypothetical protein A8C32_03520 [Flavivirga aquatica]|uniref:BioF2-like acetyltransferase domain-containing protein n=1 Tax=Flavivirga aquatica TaxID=1849968 RepID=A0A1E5TAX5_9FLAO|nr:GNAT family N-acetyltransferase [Flavivirga aquatica]OEK08535.1 hypothetical protein A8C32_03520 [Flavivirga aquatica]
MLKKIKPDNLDVLSASLEKKEALPIYNSIINSISGSVFYKDTKHIDIENNRYLYCIYDFPSYLKGVITNKNWKLKSINTYKGSLILLKNYKNADDYLKNKFSPNRRSKFKTYKRRLETCFNIEYISYYGSITKDKYDYLFEEFHIMIKKRFLEKEAKNYDLSRWEIYHEIAYSLINNKEAVLFVIYNNDKPISICLNLIRNKTIYGYIRSYDIDYSKFYIGFTDFIQQIHWCYNNGIQIFDLLKGNYPYKTKLIDSQYDFQKHVLYNSSSLLTFLSAKIIIYKTLAFYDLVRFLKKFNINILYHKILKYRHKNSESKKTKEHLKSIVITNNVKIESYPKLTKIDSNNKSLSYLKRPLYNFLYTSQESINTVEIFSINDSLDTYLIKGKNLTQQIHFQ